MSIIDRIRYLEQLTFGPDGEGPLEAVPESWVQFDPDTGQHVGPPPGTIVSEGQKRTLSQLRAMDDAVPFCGP